MWKVHHCTDCKVLRFCWAPLQYWATFANWLMSVVHCERDIVCRSMALAVCFKLGSVVVVVVYDAAGYDKVWLAERSREIRRLW